MKRLLTVLCISVISTHAVIAQSQVDQVDAADRNIIQNPLKAKSAETKIPQLYDGELEDIGPQYLLLEAPKRKWFNLFADLQVYSSDNASLFEDNPEGTDIIAATAQVAFLPYKGKFQDGDIGTRIGYRQQMFYYGALSGSSQTVNGTTARDLDFNNRQPFADVSYNRGPLSLRLGVYYSELRNRESSERFYSELAPNWSASYAKELSPTAILTYTYFGSYRISETESFGFLPDSWNDQVKNSVSATYSRLLSEKLILQAALGVTYSNYTHSDRSRNDLLRFTNLSLVYVYSDKISARVYTSYDSRSSDEALVEEYNNWNIGTAVSLNMSF